jgi:ADP-heptose:LPS heptosyltransferase
MPRPIILKNFQSPGDVVMLTAAVRDIHLQHPGRFCTDVRTSAPDIWQNNPYVTSLDDSEGETLECHYPLIHRSNQEPWHFIHGFHQYLGAQLGVSVTPTAFRGDIHLSNSERSWISQVHEIVGTAVPFWIVVSGGKQDFTAKLWSVERLQRVIDRFAGKIAFVQVGASEHQHPPLSGVLDLRAKTDLRQLIRLVYHAQGVLCPVTLVMHLAAAVDVKDGFPKNRPCVVIAGGREPPQWEAYPHHQFLHTVGSLSCCDNGGCWKSRVVPIGDGDEKDLPENLCVDVVGDLQRCMDMISVGDVVRSIELYFTGGVARYLTDAQWNAVAPHLSARSATG